MYNDYEFIQVSIEDRVATVSMTCVALASAIYEELPDCLEALGKDDNVGAIVITNVNKHFCAGGDIKSFKTRIDSQKYLSPEDILKTMPFASSPKRCPKPVIAMVNGVAAGAGMGFALGCDFRIMSPSSKLIAAFINIGLPGDSCCAYYLYKMVGAAKCAELMMTGAPISGEEAARLNLATCVDDDSKLKEATYALAKRLAHGPSQAYKWQKQLFLDIMYNDLENSVQHEALGMCTASRTDDFAEAVNAFIEKRKPTFNGK